jgi:hypothetical protein
MKIFNSLSAAEAGRRAGDKAKSYERPENVPVGVLPARAAMVSGSAIFVNQSFMVTVSIST